MNKQDYFDKVNVLLCKDSYIEVKIYLVNLHHSYVKAVTSSVVLSDYTKHCVIHPSIICAHFLALPKSHKTNFSFSNFGSAVLTFLLLSFLTFIFSPSVCITNIHTYLNKFLRFCQ